MIYNCWTVQPNILLRLWSALHECWVCIATFLGFLCIFDVKLCPWRGMAYHGGSHLLRICVICMVCASICSRPCYISPSGGRYMESYVAKVLICWQMLWCCTSRYAGSVVTLAWHTRLHKIRSQTHGLTCEACHVHNQRGFRANDGTFLGMNLWSMSPLYTTLRFDTCMEHLDICGVLL